MNAAGSAGTSAGSSGSAQAGGGSGAPSSAGGAGAGANGNGGGASTLNAGGTGAGGAAGGAGSGGLAGTPSGGAAGNGAAGSAGAGAPAAGNGGVGTGTLALSEFEIEPNPNMTISCFVSWKTAEPASSEVEFGEGEYRYRIRDAALVTEHRVLVIGMHAQKSYKLRAVSANGSGSGNAEGTFTTGMLPANIPTPELTVDELAESHAGWTLTNVQAGLNVPARVVIYDQEGVPVWYFVHGTAGDARGDVSTELLPEGVLVGPTSGEPARLVDLSGEVVWEGPPNSQQLLMSHFVVRNAAGNYVVNRELDKAVQNGNARLDDVRLEEITPEHDVVWSWTLHEHVDFTGTREDVCHGNNLTFDEAGGFLYYNCRFLGLLKIERSSGDVVWRLGGTFDETSLGPGDFRFDPPESQFSDAHEPKLFDDGTLLLYDNGGYVQGGGGGGDFRSRVVEYELDQVNKTATRTFEFPGDFAVDAWYQNDWYAPFWGDADRLPNGNILITAGVRSSSNSTRLFEITRAGKVVWELTFPANIGSYKAARLAPPPLVEAL